MVGSPRNRVNSSHIAVGSGDLGFRVWQKNANNIIDDTQVGVTLLHQDINYVLGRLSQEAINYVQPLQRNGRAYFSIAHVVSVNKGCETQLLAPCFGSPTDFTPADHEQNWSIASGVLLNDRRGAGFRPMVKTVAGCLREYARLTRQEIAKPRHTQSSMSKKA